MLRWKSKKVLQNSFLNEQLKIKKTKGQQNYLPAAEAQCH